MSKQSSFNNFTHNTLKTMTNNELTLDQLQIISGGGDGEGREAKTKIGKWIEKKLGDGDGTHEGSDYSDEVKKFGGSMLGTIIGKAVFGVHQPPGEAGPGPGVWC